MTRIIPAGITERVDAYYGTKEVEVEWSPSFTVRGDVETCDGFEAVGIWLCSNGRYREISRYISKELKAEIMATFQNSMIQSKRQKEYSY